MVKIQDAVTVSLQDLEAGAVEFSTLEDAFGPSSLGIIIVKDLPANFESLRTKLLSYSSLLARLPSHELDALTNEAAHFNIGWSHGKESLKSGQYDTMKGSFYVNQMSSHLRNLQADNAKKQATYSGFADFIAPNVWPPEHVLPGFQPIFEELCTMVIDTASLVGRAVDLYGAKKIEGYESGLLERVVKTSTTNKARLLHYFPAESSQSQPSSFSTPPTSNPTTSDEDEEDDSWCATHIDDSCLTGLTSAIYIDESSLPTDSASSSIPLPSLPDSPDPLAGLYIRSRAQRVVKVNIPTNCLAFQTGEALQMMTDGAFRAVPHFVRAPRLDPDGKAKVARNTLAVFTQPNLGVVTDRKTGMTFGDQMIRAAEKYYPGV